jgi:exodeoxyribonuclease (lambda-induced)
MEGPLNNTPEWDMLRPKLITSSNFKRILSEAGTGKRGVEFGPGAIRYALEIAAFMLTGEKPEEKDSAEMRWGREHEPFAIQAYQDQEFRTVQPGRLIQKQGMMVGASPDGFIGDDAVLEIKCPSSVMHLHTLIQKEMPEIHKAQVQGQLWVTGRSWAHFVSYDPRFKDPKKKLFVKRVERDEGFIMAMSMTLIKFQEMVLQFAQDGQHSTDHP